MNNNILSKITITAIREAAEIHTPSGQIKSVNKRYCSGLSFKLSGKTTYQSNGKEYISDENNIIFLPKDASYNFVINKNGDCYILNFDTDLPINEIHSFKVSKNKDRIKELFKESFNLKIKNLQYHEAKIKSNLYEIIYLILTENEVKNSLNRFDLINKYIDKHLSENITNEKLAEILNITPGYLLLLFKNEKQISPHQYVLMKKMNYAKSYLSFTNKQIKNIASELGYIDLYSFSKAFKKYYNISPRNYRKKHSVE